MELVLTCGRYPDRPFSQPSLAAQGNFNPERAQKGLCPPQPASECARDFWPTRPGPGNHVDCRPTWVPARKRSDALPVHCCLARNDLPQTGSHRVGVDDVFDRVAPVVRISGFVACLRGRKALSQAVVQSAKSAMRGNRWRRTCGSMCSPCAVTSRRAPSMCGRASSNSRQSACSDRRCRDAVYCRAFAVALNRPCHDRRNGTRDVNTSKLLRHILGDHVDAAQVNAEVCVLFAERPSSAGDLAPRTTKVSTNAVRPNTAARGILKRRRIGSESSGPHLKEIIIGPYFDSRRPHPLRAEYICLNFTIKVIDKIRRHSPSEPRFATRAPAPS